ncbi:hypothetical protein SCLCIDRAFT_1217648 [Scleroderma citrinum Foug A]|uniref:Uncharacterized protein n=1 Tax=Scleroderma citrinum Foug A TaxID=1036808 RepID=A0A0C2ZCH8_9AGAM|nr:hypothetical protein SCLCIDRAFT_1217648 [Scleroderma citrinum Foug A]
MGRGEYLARRSTIPRPSSELDLVVKPQSSHHIAGLGKFLGHIVGPSLGKGNANFTCQRVLGCHTYIRADVIFLDRFAFVLSVWTAILFAKERPELSPNSLALKCSPDESSRQLFHSKHAAILCY